MKDEINRSSSKDYGKNENQEIIIDLLLPLLKKLSKRKG